MNNPHDVKICFVSVGKSSLSYRMQQGKKLRSPSATVASGFLKIKLDQFSLNCWDTAGSERFDSILPMYIRGANIIVLVYDVTNIKSLENAKRKYKNFLPLASESTWILVGNKNDLCDNNLISQSVNETKQIAEETAKLWQANHCQVSAETGDGIQDLLDLMLSILQKKSSFSAIDPAIIKLSSSEENKDGVSSNGPLQKIKSNCC